MCGRRVGLGGSFTDEDTYGIQAESIDTDIGKPEIGDFLDLGGDIRVGNVQAWRAFPKIGVEESVIQRVPHLLPPRTFPSGVFW